MVSVVIPMFNAESTIGRAIQSCFDQSYRPIEILVVDDRSEDQSYKIGKEYGAICPEGIELRLLTNPGKGAPSARNYGFKKSKGEYIQFLDADDEILESKLTIQVNQLIQSNAGVAIARFLTMENGPGTLPVYGELPPGDEISTDWLICNIIRTHAPLYARSAVDSVGGWDEELEAAQDWDFHLRMSFENIPFVTSNWPLAISHLQEGSISSNLDKVYRCAFDSVKKNWPQLKTRLTPGSKGSKQILFISYEATARSQVTIRDSLQVVAQIPIRERIGSVLWWKYVLLFICNPIARPFLQLRRRIGRK